MNRIVCMVIAIMIAASLQADRVPRARIKAVYNYNHKVRHVDGYDMDRNDVMVLLASNDASRFFSAGTEQYDSLMATPGGAEKYKEMLKYAAAHALVVENGALTIDRSKIDMPRKGGTFQVERREGATTLDVFDEAAKEHYVYPVEMSDLRWDLCDSTKTVLDYECQMAVADYHGRHWTVWFAPDIAVMSGPWQLMGLPGLIMEAVSEGDEYSFAISEIESTDQPISPRPGERELIKTDRKKFRKLQHELRMHPERNFPDMKVTVKNSAASRKARSAHDLIETDYR